MAKLPSVSGAELIATLTKIGFQIICQKGSHVRLRHPDQRMVTIPVYSGKSIGKGLLLKILRDAEITKEELNRLLE